MMEQLLNQFENNHKRPQFKKITSGNKILILAPHPDDEIIGLGGTILKHVNAGNLIHIVYLTDGRKGRTREQTSEEIIKIRIIEAKKVCEQLSASYTFLNCEDGKYVPEQTKIDLLQQVIKDINPTDIYLPHINDLHRDHFMTNLLFYQSICKLNFNNCLIWQYEVWAPLFPNIVIDISNEFQKKSELLSIYKSQLQIINYQEIIEGLNKYRTSSIPIRGITHMEAFYCLTGSKYIKKVKKMFIDDLSIIE